MSNKSRGLGRGLGDLLADNAPEVRSSSVIRRDEDGEVVISPTPTPIYTETAAKLTEVRQASGEASRPLVFPAVTPIVGGEEAPEDEARAILEADAEISGKPLEQDSSSDADTSEESSKEEQGSGAAKDEQTVVYPRSLKAVFRNFK